jgi:hypothetical protein
MVGENRQLIVVEWVSEQMVEPHVRVHGQCAVGQTIVPRYRNMKVTDFLVTNKGGTTTSRPLQARGLFCFRILKNICWRVNDE